jgi:hypothetical protein
MPRHRMLGAYDRLAFACSRRRKLSASLSFLVLMLLFSVAGSQEAPIPPRNVPEVSVRPAEERDCSHLTGRLFADCLCQGALPGARNFWKAGDVLAAFAAARPCDKSSPGLDNVDRVLLHALHASATRARTGLELARQGQMLEAVTAFSELFAEAKKVPETPKGLLRGPLAHAHCRWWVITMRHETLAGVPAHPHLSALAERVGEVCAEALSDVVNSTRLQPGSTEFEGFAHRFPRQREPSESGVSEGSHTGLQIDWPKSEGPPAPWLLAARLLSLVAMGKPEQAVQEARANGASLEAGGLDFPEFISRLSAPAAVSNSSWHHSMRTRKTPKLWSMASLLLCKRWQGLRLKVCQPCSGMGVQLLFSVRTGVPVLAECNTAKGRLRGLWRRVLGHRNVLPAAFSHRVLASVWGEVLALDCIERYRHAAGAEEDTTAERRRCLIQAREATRHAGDASAALTVQAVHAFEAGDGDEFLHAMDLLVESETWSAPRGEAADGHAAHSRGGGPGLGLSENVAKVGWRGLHVLLHAVSSLQSMGSWPLALQQQAHGESAQASRLAALVALGNSGLRALLLRLKAVARSMEQWRGRMYSDDHKGIGLSPTVEMVLGKMRLMTRNRRYEVLLLWYMQSLLKAGRVQEAAGTGLAFVDARKEQMQNASSEPLTAPTPHQPSSSAQRDDPKRKDPHVRESPGGLEELASMLSLLESAERALQWAEALERSPRGGDEQPWLWPRERKWHSASRRDNNTSVHQRLRAVHTQHANETLAQLAYAVDAIAQKSAAVASIKDVAAAGGASKVRRAGAMLGVAVEVEKWRWLLAARLQRLLAHPARCMFASLHALALQDDGMSWLEGASSVATARVYTHVQTSLRSEETKALRERLVRYEKYRNTARAAQGMRAKHDTRRRSIAEAWGLEVLSDCLEVDHRVPVHVCWRARARTSHNLRTLNLGGKGGIHQPTHTRKDAVLGPDGGGCALSSAKEATTPDLYHTRAMASRGYRRRIMASCRGAALVCLCSKTSPCSWCRGALPTPGAPQHLTRGNLRRTEGRGME